MCEGATTAALVIASGTVLDSANVEPLLFEWLLSDAAQHVSACAWLTVWLDLDSEWWDSDPCIGHFASS